MRTRPSLSHHHIEDIFNSKLIISNNRMWLYASIKRTSMVCTNKFLFSRYDEGVQALSYCGLNSTCALQLASQGVE